MTREATLGHGASGARPELSSLAPISKETVQERVYASLRTAIMRGEVKPGQNLTIPGLAATFGTSAMPVRQALFRLVAERALMIVSGRTVGVPPLSRSRLRDLTRVRLEVEGLAAAWAAETRTTSLIDELTLLVDQMWQHLDAGDAGGFLNRNQAFHFAVYRSSGSPTLIPIIESLWLQIGPYLNLLHRSGNFQAANEHHEALKEALARGDGAGARSALERDIRKAAELLLTLVTRD
jgi:DNA-binding GntR family transcriptional regulator